MTDAEKKWEDHCKRVFYLGPPEERIVAMAILKDFKQALREAIEEQMVVRGNGNHYAEGRTWAFKKVLELLYTVTPK